MTEHYNQPIDELADLMIDEIGEILIKHGVTQEELDEFIAHLNQEWDEFIAHISLEAADFVATKTIKPYDKLN